MAKRKIQETGGLTWRDLQKANDYNFSEVNSEEDYNFNNSPVLKQVQKYNPLRTFNPDAYRPIEFAGSDYGNSAYDERFDVYNQEQLNNLNEQRAAVQTNTEKILSGIGKAGVLAGTTFLDTAGLLTGTFNIISEASQGNIHSAGDAFNAFIDNPYSQALMSINEKAEEWMPNYTSEFENSMPWIQRAFSKDGWANFWGDHVLKNSGFFVGAMLSGKASAGLISKLNGLDDARNIFKKLAVVASDGKEIPTEEALSALLNGNATIAAKGFEKALEATAQSVRRKEFTTRLASSMIGSIGESRMEALMNSNDYLKSAYQSLDSAKQDELLKLQREYANAYPDAATIKEFNERQAEIEQRFAAAEADLSKQGQNYANWSFFWNTIFTGSTNYLNMGKFFTGNYNMSKSIQNAVIRSGGKFAAESPKKYIGKAVVKGIAEGPIAEGMQEMLQESTTQALNRYEGSRLNSLIGYKVNPDAAMQQGNILQAMAEGMGATFSDFEYWENFIIGALYGAMPLPGRTNVAVRDADGKYSSKNKWYVSGELYDSIREAKAELANASEVVKALNDAVSNPNRLNSLLSRIADEQLKAEHSQAVASGNRYDSKNKDLIELCNVAGDFIQAGRWEDLLELTQDYSNISDEDLESIKDIQDSNGEYIYKNFSRDELLEVFKKENAKILEKLDTYKKLYDANNTLFGNSISSQGLTELTYIGMTLDDKENRIKQIVNEVRSIVRDNADLIKAVDTDGDLEDIDTVLENISNFDVLFNDTPAYRRLRAIINDSNFNSEFRNREEAKNSLLEAQKALQQSSARKAKVEAARWKKRIANLKALGENATPKQKKLLALYEKEYDKHSKNILAVNAKLQTLNEKISQLKEQSRIATESFEDAVEAASGVSTKFADLVSLLIDRNDVLSIYNDLRKNPEKIDKNIADTILKSINKLLESRERRKYERYKSGKLLTTDTAVTDEELERYRKYAVEDNDSAAINKIDNEVERRKFRQYWDEILNRDSLLNYDTILYDAFYSSVNIIIDNSETVKEAEDAINTMMENALQSGDEDAKEFIKAVKASKADVDEVNAVSKTAKKTNTESSDSKQKSSEDLMNLGDEYTGDDENGEEPYGGIDSIGVNDDDKVTPELVDFIKNIGDGYFEGVSIRVLEDDQDTLNDHSRSEVVSAFKIVYDEINADKSTEGGSDVSGGDPAGIAEQALEGYTPSAAATQVLSKPVSTETMPAVSILTADDLGNGFDNPSNTSKLGDSEANVATSTDSQVQDVLHVGRAGTVYDIDKLKKHRLSKRGSTSTKKDGSKSFKFHYWQSEFLDITKAQEFIDSGELVSVLKYCAKNGITPVIRFVQYRGGTKNIAYNYFDNRAAANSSLKNTVFAAIEIPDGYGKYKLCPAQTRKTNDSELYGNQFYSRHYSGTKRMQVLGMVSVDKLMKDSTKNLFDSIIEDCNKDKGTAIEDKQYIASQYTTGIEHIFTGRLIRNEVYENGAWKTIISPLKSILGNGSKPITTYEGNFQIEVIGDANKTWTIGKPLDGRREIPLNPYRYFNELLKGRKINRNSTVWLKTVEADGSIVRKSLKLASFNQNWDKLNSDSAIASKIRKAIKESLKENNFTRLRHYLYYPSNTIIKNGDTLIIKKVSSLDSNKFKTITVDLTQKNAEKEVYDALLQANFRFSIGTTKVDQHGNSVDAEWGVTLADIVDSNIVLTDLAQIHNAGASLMLSIIDKDEAGNFIRKNSSYIESLKINGVTLDGEILHTGVGFKEGSYGRVFADYHSGDRTYFTDTNGIVHEIRPDENGKKISVALPANDIRTARVLLSNRIKLGLETPYEQVFLPSKKKGTKARIINVYKGVDNNGNEFFLTGESVELTDHDMYVVDKWIHKTPSQSEKTRKSLAAYLSSLIHTNTYILNEDDILVNTLGQPIIFKPYADVLAEPEKHLERIQAFLTTHHTINIADEESIKLIEEKMPELIKIEHGTFNTYTLTSKPTVTASGVDIARIIEEGAAKEKPAAEKPAGKEPQNPQKPAVNIRTGKRKRNVVRKPVDPANVGGAEGGEKGGKGIDVAMKQAYSEILDNIRKYRNGYDIKNISSLADSFEKACEKLVGYTNNLTPTLVDVIESESKTCPSVNELFKIFDSITDVNVIPDTDIMTGESTLSEEVTANIENAMKAVIQVDKCITPF